MMEATNSPRHAGRRRIFISYRRDDSQCVAGRLADALSAYFGDQRVFRDVDGIATGERFLGMLFAPLMLVLMSLSGFKPR